MRSLPYEDERSAARMIAKGRREPGYDVVVLDLPRPIKNGLEDRITGRDAGADGYRTQAFHWGELLAQSVGLPGAGMP